MPDATLPELTLPELVRNGTMSEQMAAVLWSVAAPHTGRKWNVLLDWAGKLTGITPKVPTDFCSMQLAVLRSDLTIKLGIPVP